MRFWSLWHEDLWQNMTRFVEQGLRTCNFSMKTCQTCQQQKLDKCWLRKLLSSQVPYVVFVLELWAQSGEMERLSLEKNSWSHNNCTISKYRHTINKNTQKAQQNVFGTKSSEFISTQGADYRKSFDYKLWVALRLINYIRVLGLSY